MRKYVKFLITGFIIILLSYNVTGCDSGNVNKNTSEKRKIEFTVMDNNDIPKKLMKKIDSQKKNEFKLTYSDDEYLYIASGYGEMPSGGYNISVIELYSTKEGVFYKTKLTGPQKGDQTNKVKTYPYIVVKTEKINQEVFFQ